MTDQTLTSPQSVPTIGGEQVTIPQFSAFKAIVAMEIITEIEGAFRKVLETGADFRHEYSAKHYLEMGRAEARRQYAPQPLLQWTENEDGMAIASPVLNDQGAPVLGPDPLGHLTEQDWEQSDHKLRIPEHPDEKIVTAAMIPVGFKLASKEMFRLIALAITPNRSLEQWDEAGDNISDQLDAEAKRLIHRCTAAEPLDLFVAAMVTAKDEVAAPFDRAVTSLRAVFQMEQEQTGPTVEPMTMETEPEQESGESASSPTSSTPSADGTAGTPAPSSTDRVGAA